MIFWEKLVLCKKLLLWWISYLISYITDSNSINLQHFCIDFVKKLWQTTKESRWVFFSEVFLCSTHQVADTYNQLVHNTYRKWERVHNNLHAQYTTVLHTFKIFYIEKKRKFFRNFFEHMQISEWCILKFCLYIGFLKLAHNMQNGKPRDFILLFFSFYDSFLYLKRNVYKKIFQSYCTHRRVHYLLYD